MISRSDVENIDYLGFLSYNSIAEAYAFIFASLINILNICNSWQHSHDCILKQISFQLVNKFLYFELFCTFPRKFSYYVHHSVYFQYPICFLVALFFPPFMIVMMCVLYIDCYDITVNNCIFLIRV